MIFVGDIASATEDTSRDFYSSISKNIEVFQNDIVVANLEGLISEEYYRTKKPVLSNHPSVIKPLLLMNTKAVTLANNHTLDLPDNLQITKNLLKENNILHFGAGIDKDEASLPCVFRQQNFKFYILGYSWDILMQHQKNPTGSLYVNTINEKKILDQIKDIKGHDPEAKIVIKIHWNFDLETIPFPLHRKFSRAMIDAGANAIIGSHSHCVQGGERYKNGIIIYGLGNFFFPWYIFTSGKSYFPDWTKPELALQWNPETNQVKCHWFEYNYTQESHEINYIKSEDFDSGEKILEFSPYRNMSDDYYLRWYKINRRKGFLLPVYRDHSELLRNFIIDSYLKKRIRFARFLAKKNLRNWKR